jgi:membrane protein
MRFRTFWSVIKQTAANWWNDNCVRLAASLAYYTALSLAPLVIIVVGLAGMVTEPQRVAMQLEAQLELLIGQPSRQLVHTIVMTTEPQGGTLAAIIGIVTLLLSATAVFGELQAALNLIWEVKPTATRSVWSSLWFILKQRLLSLAIVLAIAFLLLVSLVISAALAGAATYLRGQDQTPLLLGRVLEAAISLLVNTLLFALLFKYVPDARIRWHDVWLGGCVSAVLFTIGKVAIGYYIGSASVGSAYGAAGSLIVLLVWVFYSSLIFFFGAEFTHVWATRHHAVEPKPHAESGAAPQTKSAAAEDVPNGCDMRYVPPA